jgi:hypothetical protein
MTHDPTAPPYGKLIDFRVPEEAVCCVKEHREPPCMRGVGRDEICDVVRGIANRSISDVSRSVVWIVDSMSLRRFSNPRLRLARLD